jgi:glutamate--cysteine ligase
MAKEGEQSLVEQADYLMTEIQKKYDEYEIDQKPFLVIKADAGTYGMAVMMIHDPNELRNLNRKERTRMANIKGGREVRQVILQEGVATSETWGKDNASAEPVIYMIGKHVVGGFYRVHAEKGTHENLNAPGMNFEPLAFAKSCNNPDEEMGSCANRFYAYGVIARLALIAAARELVSE